ncbi:MAG: hypothetical protein OER91_13735 [Gammaproteobacteria bacterium]|nr:hypothetical protein [Gammaproteobacteria bacterium]
MTDVRRVAAHFVAALATSTLLFAGCSTPARPDRMTSEAAPITESAEPPQIATVFVTVYGDDVGGFASHFIPLPRSDFEKALLDTIAGSRLFAATSDPAAADYALNVGLISLVVPQWSGTATLETSWSITTPVAREEISRKMVRTSSPSPFSRQREATENSAKTNIAAGLKWLAEQLGPREDQG